MSATSNLAEFIYKLPEHLHAEFRELVDAVADERDRHLNELIATSQACTKPFEVVAIAGTAETLLSDTINVGDTVELNPNVKYYTTSEMEAFILDGVKSLNKVTGEHKDKICLNDGDYWHRIELFRKVSTPLSNPIQTVSGC